VARKALNEHWKVIFNGNGYDPDNQAMLTKMGLCRIDSNVEAMCVLGEEKNIKLFESAGVLTADECKARSIALLEHYIGTVEMEVQCMIDMILQHVVPSLRSAGEGIPIGTIEKLQSDVTALKVTLYDIHHESDTKKKAELCHLLRLEKMVEVREHCDAAEGVCPAHLWTLGTYKELLFLDHTR